MQIGTTTRTKRLPSDDGRITDVIFQVLMYNVFRNNAVGGRKYALPQSGAPNSASSVAGIHAALYGRNSPSFCASVR